MQEKNKEIIKEGINEYFSAQKEISKIQLEMNFELLLSQIDFFKAISSFIIAVAGIGLYAGNFNSGFLFVSLMLGIIILLFTVSYARETIDEEQRDITEMVNIVNKETTELIKKGVDAIKSENENIYFEYLNKKINEEENVKEMPNYIGEIISFMFYLSVGFLFISFLPKDFMSYLLPYKNHIIVIFLLLFSYLLSFKNWALKLSKLLSKKIL